MKRPDEPPPRDWEALGQAVEKRRNELGLTIRAAAERSREGGRRGFDEQTWGHIEKATRNNRRVSTLRALCWVLGWTDDSVDLILAGGEPIERVDPKPRSPIEAALDEDSSITEAERRVFQAILDLVEERKSTGGS
jgi:hypothetical protein